jgi:hypothetical protein
MTETEYQNNLKELDDRIYLLENTKRFKRRNIEDMENEIGFLKLERDALILLKDTFHSVTPDSIIKPTEVEVTEGGIEDLIAFQVAEIKDIVDRVERKRGRKKNKVDSSSNNIVK